MSWTVLYHPDFVGELEALNPDVADKLREIVAALHVMGPQLGRPRVDTLKGSRHGNMKEARIALKGAWRFAFAFDPDRAAIILCGGNQEGGSEKKFYRDLIAVADARFDDWLESED